MKRHTESITFACPPPLKKKIEAAAKGDRRPLSEWLRIVVEEALKASVEKKTA